MGAAVSFVVEQAGCPSCAARVRSALEGLAAVEEITVDERADEATVRLAGEVGEGAVGAALAAASDGGGHAYRMRPGSWRAA